MRITIDIDQEEAATPAPGAAEGESEMADAQDGGAFDGSRDASAPGSSSADEIDAGGPPDWLVAEIEAAAGASSDDDNQADGAEDAGGGPA